MEGLMHFKTKNGDDIVGFVELINDEHFIVRDAVQICIHPSIGLYTRKWLYLSKNKEAVIDTFDVMYLTHASEQAIELYTEALYKEAEEQLDDLYGTLDTTYH